MTDEEANAVFDILVEHAGVAEWHRAEFVRVMGGPSDGWLLSIAGKAGWIVKFRRHECQLWASSDDLVRYPILRERVDAANAALRKHVYCSNCEGVDPATCANNTWRSLP